MKWYRRNTRRWIGRSSTSLGQVVDMVEQLHISSSAPPPNFTLANVHQPPPLFWMHSESMIALCSSSLVSQHHHHRHWFSRHLKRRTKVAAELVDSKPD
ncbi:hypothetical protein PIB30_030910 [Stylosanthes scabra]|uniref:SAC domain-containing protein n=1 Tax=Stylosanthes scabra TaxID=79078 RepID=A0ABU6Z8P1_9FABA|nr:hypothetical protein [Stylosanthes scabra]